MGVKHSPEGLPWPAVVPDRLYLPIALEWFIDGDRSRSRG
jgi:hypothetical protein